MWQKGLFFISGFILGKYYSNNNTPPPSSIRINSFDDEEKETQTNNLSYKELRAYAKSIGIVGFHKMKLNELERAIFTN